MPEQTRRVLIVDDEPAARAELRSVIESFSQLALIGELTDGHSAVHTIAEEQPDIVFLDVDMPGIDGFGVAEATRHLRYHLVFVTAHHRFALNAFDTHAIDFLLKPARPALVRKCIDKILRHEELVLEKLTPAMPPTARLVLAEGGTSRVLDWPHILLIEALGRYRRIQLSAEGAALHGQQTLISDTTLDEFKVLLREGPFMRVHRSYIVNLRMVLSLHTRARRHFLSVAGYRDEIPVSRTQVKALREALPAQDSPR